MYNFADLEKEWKDNDDPEKGVVIFIPEDNKLIRAVFGDGVNTTPGFDDYTYITVHDLDDMDFEEVDGGQLDVNYDETDYFNNLSHFCEESIAMVGYEDVTEWYVLSII